MPISKNDVAILTLEDWETSAGPRSPDHWTDGRSAKEAARAWLEGDAVDPPKELMAALKRHEAFGRLTTWWAEPDARLPFDGFGGEPCNADLVVHAEDAHGTYLITVEAKSDEPFSNTVGDTLGEAVDRLLENERSHGIARITQLAAALLGPRVGDDPPLKDLRYQLLTASAGCLAEAERRGHTRALLLIQEFVTDRTVDKKLLLNAIDLGRFVKRLSHGAFKAVNPGDIVGPFRVPGAPLLAGGIDFYIGKISRNLRSRRG
ncbi:MAG: hypothetical protein ABI277_00635 [Burkholderiaceae bacterium]